MRFSTQAACPDRDGEANIRGNNGWRQKRVIYAEKSELCVTTKNATQTGELPNAAIPPLFLLTAGKIFKLETKQKALTFFLSGDLA